MNYVLDSSVAVKTILPEVDSDKAIRLWDAGRARIHLFLSPDVFHVEAAHSLTRAERQKRISPADSWQGWRSIMTDCPQLHSSIPLMPRAYRISSDMRIGVYDCLNVALAEREGCAFVTADDKLVNRLQSQFPFIVPLSSMP